MIISLRPRKKFVLMDYLPDFDYDSDVSSNENDSPSPMALLEPDESDESGSLSERLYKEFDGQTASMFLYRKLFFFLLIIFFICVSSIK